MSTSDKTLQLRKRTGFANTSSAEDALKSVFSGDTFAVGEPAVAITNGGEVVLGIQGSSTTGSTFHNAETVNKLIDVERQRAEAAEANRYTKTETYTQQQVNAAIAIEEQRAVTAEAQRYTKSETYSSTQIDNKIAEETQRAETAEANRYTKSEVDGLISAEEQRAKAAEALRYTKTEVDGLIDEEKQRAEAAEALRYTKTEVDGLIDEEKQRAEAAEANRYTKDETYNRNETYTKQEVNRLLSTPNVNYVTVTATSATTDVTEVLPSSGETDTIYRVGNWDGMQFDDTVYSEYAWDGADYVHLATKSQIGEVFDVSAYYSSGGVLQTYSGLTEALGAQGSNIPDGIRRGGMSIKFVQTYDNNYVQYLYVGTSIYAADFTNTDNWEKMNLEEELSELGQEIIGIQFNGEFVISATGEHSSTTGMVSVSPILPIGTYNIKIETGTTGNSGTCALYVRYEGETSNTKIGNTTIGNVLTFTTIKPVIALGVYMSASVNQHIGTMPISVEMHKYLTKSILQGWVLSESFTVVNATYTDGIINSPVSVVWPDGTSGTLAITRNDDGLVTSVVIGYGSDSYSYTITRDSDGNVTNTTLVKQ